MKKLLNIVGWVLCLSAPCIAGAGTLFTSPTIVVTPATLDFGAVPGNAIATNTFLVENIGTGTLVGKVTVAAPFEILSGGDYSLRAHEAQIITVVYAPSGADSDTQTAMFTGGGGATATVTGKLPPVVSKKSKRKPSPAKP